MKITMINMNAQVKMKCDATWKFIQWDRWVRSGMQKEIQRVIEPGKENVLKEIAQKLQRPQQEEKRAQEL